MADVRMKDIADALGVSVVTVSNALSGKKGVSMQMRERIEETARQMGYNVPGNEKKEQEGVIGVIASERYLAVGSSFYWALYQQVAYAASRKGSMTMLEILSIEKEEKNKMPNLLTEGTISGLIVIGLIPRPYLEKLEKVLEVPMVLLDFKMDGIRCDAILSSNYIGMYKVTRYLIERGHRDIAFVGTIEATENIMDRYYGYQKAMAEADIPLRPEWILRDRDAVTGSSDVRLPERMPTAFACNCDWSAGTLYDLLKENGYEVPEDVSIVSYDNYLYGNDFAEQLTTYNVDMKEMARLAIDKLLDKIKGNDMYQGVRYVDSIIVERGSVKRLVEK
ncbi:MAG: LacI family DNA-binding transcriptional regulator [Clostridiales bacterium]|nr:LacI family DNA-binding transcriptional regulator [Clostridiales bacterium]